MTTPSDQVEPGPRWQYGARFSPQVLVLVLTLVVAARPLKHAIVSGVLWWWRDSYRQVELVMEAAQANDGYPYIDGHADGIDDVVRLVGVMRDGAIAPRAAPEQTFAPGKRVRIWHAPDAPTFTVEGEEVNDFPVEARPTLPTALAFASDLLVLLATLGAGLFATLWVGARWARTYGTLPIRRRFR